MILTEYTLPGERELHIALVSDLHEHDPSELLTMLKAQQPDLVCVAGDTFERQSHGSDPRSRKDYGLTLRLVHTILRAADGMIQKRKKNEYNPVHAFRFLKEASAIAPVVLSLGNHEWYLDDADKALLTEYKITLLHNTDMLWRGIRIGGLPSEVDTHWLARFSRYPEYKLLLCHHPEFYPRYVRPLPIDLVLSGHAHGGQVRIFGRGLFSTGQGLLPKYYHGVYDGRLVVSAGCSNTAALPRWGNPTELVMIHLKPTNKQT